MDKSINGAGIVVFRRLPRKHPEFLLLKAKWGRHWSIPKGHRDKKSEAVLTTALRETEEETGIGQDNLQLMGDFDETVEYRLRKRTRNCPDGIKRVKLYLAKVSEDTQVELSEEHTEYRWVTIPGTLQLLPSDFHESLIKADLLARSL